MEKIDQEIEYWQNKLKNIAPILDFPTDKSRSTIDELKGENNYQRNTRQNSFTLERNFTQTLLETAQQNKVSLPVLLLGAFQVLLYRYTKQSNIVVGCLDWHDNSQDKLGILPINVAMEDELNFLDLLMVVQEQASESSSYSIGIDTSTPALRGKPEFITDPLSQVLFKYSNLITDIKAKLTTKIAKKELFLEVVEKPQHLVCNLEYNCYLFDELTIKRIANNYQVLLKSIVTNPDTLIASLPILSATEKGQVLFDWNQTQAESVPLCIHQLFATHVKQNPEATAIICQGQQLTYGELNQKANQLARYLQDMGVAKGSLVGLCVERSLSMVVGILAILKAGGAYVPLDISNPSARLAFILKDAKVKVLLTQIDLLAKLPAQTKQTICIDRDQEAIAKYSQADLELDITISDLAHIVYTSGSTGKPKGVMLTHGNLSHYAQSLQLAFEITPADVYLHRGSIALIVSARQLLMPLAQGATALIVTTAETKNPLEFFALIKRHGVTIVDHVPSFWRNFWGILDQQDEAWRQDLLDNQVRLVAAGGEQVTPEIYQCWRETFKPNVKLANIYGQTEGTGVVTVYQIPNRLERSFKSLPVGRPIPNMKVYLLDKDLQPVPIGVAAEIHISGAGVAQGYLNRPELTAEKFVTNPYVKGERLYKTGDLGRYLANGSIQFLGRVDRQVNIQGLRIELGEIEAVLSQHELVVEAAVIVRKNNLGEFLAAYIVPNTKQPPTAEILKSYLQQKLPPYMIPKRFIFLDTFPQTTSGKVDLRALAALNLDESEGEIIAPRDRLESEIVELLKNILGISKISIQDNFIELGGNSLLAARLVTEIEHQYARKIAISRVFQAPTAEAIANLIRQGENKSFPKSCVPIKQGNSELIIFGIHSLGYGLEFYRPLAKYLNDDLSLYGLSSSFSDEPDKPHFRDVANSAAYYVDNIQQIQPQGPYHLVGVSFGGIIAYEIAQLLTARGQEVRFLGLLDSYFPHQNASYKPSLKKRAFGHLQKIRTEGLSHILDRVKWRVEATQNYIRYGLYKIDWIRNNLVDQTSRNFAQTEYIQQKREQEKLNHNYGIQPYSGVVHMFRAANDIDSKLEWHKLAPSGLLIHDIPGEHLEILQEPNVRILAEKITLALKHDEENDGVGD